MEDFIRPGVLYRSHNPQLPTNGMKVKIVLLDDRELNAVFEVEGYNFIDENGGRWNLANPNLKGWMVV